MHSDGFMHSAANNLACKNFTNHEDILQPVQETDNFAPTGSNGIYFLRIFVFILIW